MTKAALWCTLAYVLALTAAALTVAALPNTHPIWQVAWADVVGTLVVFAFSRGFDNSSFYDPYWSVAPLAILPYWWGVSGAANVVRAALVCLCVAAWGVRLTYNWARRWQGMKHEDWRYVDLRDKHGDRYWWVSLAGIHLFPTVLVFLGCVPAYFVFTVPHPLSVLDAVAGILATTGLVVEAVADRQLHDFLARRPPPTETLSTGLWRHSRHPNYFGEVTFWWGVGLFGVAAAPGVPWSLAGALSITLLFVFISVPMIDARMLARRPAFAERMRRTRAIVPWPIRRGR